MIKVLWNFLKIHLFIQRKLKNLTHFILRGDELSPVKHLYLKVTALERSEKVEVLEKFVDKVNENRYGWHVYFATIPIFPLSLSTVAIWSISDFYPFVFCFVFVRIYSVLHGIWPLQMQAIWIGWKKHVRNRVYVWFAIVFWPMTIFNLFSILLRPFQLNSYHQFKFDIQNRSVTKKRRN